MNPNPINQLIQTQCPIEMEYVLAASILYKLKMEITKVSICTIIQSTGHSPDWTQIRMLTEYNMRRRVEVFSNTLTETGPTTMVYILASLILHKLRGETTEDGIGNIIKSTGTTPNDLQVRALMSREHHIMEAELAILRKKFNDAPVQGTIIAITIDGPLNASLINAVKHLGVTKRHYVKEALIRRLTDDGHIANVTEINTQGRLAVFTEGGKTS